MCYIKKYCLDYRLWETLIDLKQYQRKLYSITTNKYKFSKIKGIVTGKDFMEGLNYDLFIKHQINNLLLVKPIFKNT